MKKLCNTCLLILLMLFLVSCMNSSKDRESDNNQNPQNHDSSSECQVPFSLDKGVSWNTSDNRLPEFDIWGVETNEEIPEMVFFSATSYEQLLEEVEKNRTTTFDAYRYLDNDGWNELLDTYNEKYFEENILLFYYKFERTKEENYVYNVEIKDNSLTLNVNCRGGGWMIVTSWLEFVTIKKTDAENVTEFNVALRGVSELQSSIILFELEGNPYMRDLYVNGLSTVDFPGLNNLESVNVWTNPIMIDLFFNETVPDERFNEIVTILKTSENIDSVGYTSNTWIRVTLKNNFYDKYIDKTLTLSDVLDNKIENSDGFTMEINDMKPSAIITLEMKQHGRVYYEAMRAQLKELNFPFISVENLN